MKDDLEKIFETKRNEFDFTEPRIGHFDRFEAKLKGAKLKKVSNKTPWFKMAVAAAVLLIFGFWLGNNNLNNRLDLADVSPKMHETKSFYLATINKEMDLINKRKTPENQKIIDDAFNQLAKLELSYEKLTFELKESSKDKRVIYAMITNLQSRLEVLQNLMNQLEKIDNLKTEKRV